MRKKKRNTLVEAAAARREHRAELRALHDREEARREVRCALQACEEFSDPRVRPVNPTGLVDWERMNMLSPLLAEWSKANNAYSEEWVSNHWRRLAAALAASGDAVGVKDLLPSDDAADGLAEMHGLFLRCLEGMCVKLIFRDLAKVRASFEPGADERGVVGLRWMLRAYFAWLRMEIGRSWRGKELEATRTPSVRVGASVAPQTRTGGDEGGTDPNWPERVLALIFSRGRDWSVRRLAGEVKVHPSTMYRNEKVSLALKARRAPGGWLKEGSLDGEKRRGE